MTAQIIPHPSPRHPDLYTIERNGERLNTPQRLSLEEALWKFDFCVRCEPQSTISLRCGARVLAERRARERTVYVDSAIIGLAREKQCLGPFADIDAAPEEKSHAPASSDFWDGLAAE
jgi:hypothetical protein